MKFGITPPGCQCSMEQVAFGAYSYHQQQIEDFINALAATPDPNDDVCQRAAYEYARLDPDSLTRDERLYIEREVAKRI